MDNSLLLRDKSPLISIHGLVYTSIEFIDFASKGYRLLSELYEANKKIGVQELLERIGAIRFGEWRQHPSQCRRLSKAILNATMILQSIVGDERDLQAVLNQKKVSAAWRNEQRHQLMDFVKLKAVETNCLEDEDDRVASVASNGNDKVTSSTANQPHSYHNCSIWDEFSIDELPM